MYMLKKRGKTSKHPTGAEGFFFYFALELHVSHMISCSLDYVSQSNIDFGMHKLGNVTGEKGFHSGNRKVKLLQHKEIKHMN